MLKRPFLSHNSLITNNKEKPVKASAIQLKHFFIFCILVAQCSSVNAQSNLTLHDSLTAAVEKQSSKMPDPDNSALTDNNNFDWLDGSPSASLVYLDSQQNLGTTESEISLNLPIKSPFLRKIEKSLSSKVDALRTSAQKQYALFLSGIIRDIVWEIQIEKLSATAVSKKQSILAELTLQYKEMAQAQAIPQYVSLIVQKEFNDHQISLMQHQQNINNLMAKYYRLTGLNALPSVIIEAAPNVGQMDINAHPDIVALDNTFQSTEQTLLSTSKSTAPWNVQITGKRVETPGFSENQLGLGIEVPINIVNQLSTLQQSEYSKINTEYQIARSKLMHELSEAQANLMQEYKFLQQKQTLLDSSTANLSALTQAMTELREANAPNQEFYIRTLLDTVDSEYSIELNQIHLQRHIALMRQAAGLTL